MQTDLLNRKDFKIKTKIRSEQTLSQNVTVVKIEANRIENLHTKTEGLHARLIKTCNNGYGCYTSSISK